MADLVMGAMGRLIPKLHELLKEEYNMQTHVKERIRSLSLELEHAQATLHMVAEVPWDQLDKQVQLWAREVREGSYDMEDVLDAFLVRVQGPADSAEQEKRLLKPFNKMANLLKTSKARRKISGDVKDIMTHLQEVAERCHRYKVDDIVARPAAASTIDPRLHAMYNKVKNLVGIDKSSGQLMSMLQSSQLDDASDKKVKIVSIVGVGGLGKTTLAKVVYDKLRGSFDCGAFVPVGRSPDLKKIFKDIFMEVDKQRYLQFSTVVLDERQLIDELRSILRENKRYLIVIDDVWEVQSWETIKLAMDDGNDSGSRIIITTRKLEVATKADAVYKLQPLSYERSRELFLTRISGDDGKYIQNQPDEISDKYIRKCSGIPLAIITMASSLAGKQREKWPQLYNTIDFGSKDNKEAENTMRILSFSYYDLPAHLRTCLLYLSAFPEDSFIPKRSLVWKWVAEGFIPKKEGMRLFEIGEGYFNDLINRSMIEAVESYSDDTFIHGCRVHDVVLDFIRSISRQENFFTILDNNHTLLQNNVRRLANHNRTKGHSHEANHIEMPKLRSFIALGSVPETWAQLASFTLLRVLAIENCIATADSCVGVEHLGCLVQLRFLSLRGSRIGRIPEEIGALRFLQTLDLFQTDISEFPSSGCLPNQLACLSISPPGGSSNGKVFSVEAMTSLEELTITFSNTWAVKRLGCLIELRVLTIFYYSCKLEEERDLVESLGHLHKLQSLRISAHPLRVPPTLEAKDLLLSHDLQYLDLDNIFFSKLPSCIAPSCHPNLSHLSFGLKQLDEEDLKTLGRLPELRYLGLAFGFRSPRIFNISDSDACYFPKLRCFKLRNSIFSFATNKDDMRVSFNIWNGEDNTSMPSVSDDELERARPSVSGDEEDLKTLSRLPDLHYLGLDFGISSPATILNISDSDACYFPKLRCFKLSNSIFSFVANKDDMRVSFHTWNEEDNTSMPSDFGDELERARPSVSDDELKSGNEMQSPMPSVSHDDELHRPNERSQLQQGFAAVAYYLLAFFLHVLAYVKRWPLKLMGQHPLPSSNGASSPGNVSGNGEDPASTPSVSDDENKGSTICSEGAAVAAAAPRFMPSLQVLHLDLDRRPAIPDSVYNLGWEHFSSLREINADLYWTKDGFKKILERELRRATEVHPNHPTLNFKRIS